MIFGGVCIIFVYLVISFYSYMFDEVRRVMGIIFGLFRLLVGIEDVDDLIEDFN